MVGRLVEDHASATHEWEDGCTRRLRVPTQAKKVAMFNVGTHEAVVVTIAKRVGVMKLQAKGFNIVRFDKI
jgi:hypothetical protein